MRNLTVAVVAALFALPGLAAAAEPVVSVTFGPKMDKKLTEYGRRDTDRLAGDLERSVLREAARTGALEDARIELVIEDVVPNRPTFQQMADKPGLSFESFGVGGAKVSGTVTTADGRSFPVSYSWYETDIRWAQTAGTWTDAESAFDRFARRIAAGDAVAAR